jgi:4'-phosphopantetheinyl transferase
MNAPRARSLAWHSGEGPGSLGSSDIHVWRLALTGPSYLRERAACRRFLRRLLGRYLGVAPGSVALDRGPYGKPCLDPRVHGEDIQFNLSHSGRIALFALARDRRVGIDVQRMEARPSGRDDLLLRSFTETERAAIMSVAPGKRGEAFYACWARKEAAIKALGGSVTSLARVVAVSAVPEDSPQLVELETAGGGRARWQIQDLPIDDGYAAALCGENPPCSVFLWQSAQGPEL